MRRFELKQSYALAAVIVFAHAAAAASVLLCLDGTPAALLALALVLLGVASAWGRALLRSPSSVRVIEVDGARASLELATHERWQAEVAERCHVSRWLVTLPVTRPARRTLLVTRDMLDAESFRHLRLWTLWRRLPATD